MSQKHKFVYVALLNHAQGQISDSVCIQFLLESIIYRIILINFMPCFILQPGNTVEISLITTLAS